MKGWRPITLLNTIYKIYAKLLALRLQPFLLEIVHESQTGFMQERSIFDNIFLFWELTGMAMKTKEDLAVLLLDFEKAYDRVDWDFMEGSLLRLGFPAQWIRVVASLYREAFSSDLIGGGQIRKFSISRSVRQGCPLAPFLFFIVMETFSMYLNSSQVSRKGLPLPSMQQQLLDSEFSDDTAIYVQGNDDNLRRLQLAVGNSVWPLEQR